MSLTIKQAIDTYIRWESNDWTEYKQQGGFLSLDDYINANRREI